MMFDIDVPTFDSWFNLLNLIGVFTATGMAALSAKYARDSVLEQKKHDNPHVVVYVQQRPKNFHIVDLVIKNEGIRSAKSVRFKVTGTSIDILNERKINDIEIIKNGIELVSGGQVLKQPLGILLGKQFDIFKKANTFIHVSYADAHGQKYSGDFRLGFDGLIDRQLGGGDEIKKGVKAIQDTSKALNKIKQDIHLIAQKGIVAPSAEPYYPDDTFQVEDITSKD